MDMVRITEMRGIVKNTASPRLNDHLFIIVSSVAFLRASTASLVLSSCNATSSSVVVGLFVFQLGFKRSSSSEFNVMVIHLGNSATCVANRPRVIDFSCGFQSF